LRFPEIADLEIEPPLYLPVGLLGETDRARRNAAESGRKRENEARASSFGWGREKVSCAFPGVSTCQVFFRSGTFGTRNRAA
jgi:hypothetical protein